MRQNERRLLKELYEDYSVPLKRFAASIGVHYDDIEDIVHDTIMGYYYRYPMDWDAKLKTTILIKILYSRWRDSTGRIHAVLRVSTLRTRNSCL